MMKYKLALTNQFKKGYKLMKKRNADFSKLEYVVDKLIAGDSLDEKYRDHQLMGQYSGCRECHISPDWLLVYMVREDILTLTLLETGTHSDLF